SHVAPLPPALPIESPPGLRYERMFTNPLAACLMSLQNTDGNMADGGLFTQDQFHKRSPRSAAALQNLRPRPRMGLPPWSRLSLSVPIANLPFAKQVRICTLTQRRSPTFA